MTGRRGRPPVLAHQRRVRTVLVPAAGHVGRGRVHVAAGAGGGRGQPPARPAACGVALDTGRQEGGVGLAVVVVVAAAA